MRAGAWGQRAGGCTSGGSDYGEMAERAADFPQPSHGACEGGMGLRGLCQRDYCRA